MNNEIFEADLEMDYELFLRLDKYLKDKYIVNNNLNPNEILLLDTAEYDNGDMAVLKVYTDDTKVYLTVYIYDTDRRELGYVEFEDDMLREYEIALDETTYYLNIDTI